MLPCIVDVLGPADGVAHPACLTDGDELLKGLRLFAFGDTLLDRFALQLL